MKLILLFITLTSLNALGFDLISHKDLSTGEFEILTSMMEINNRPIECLVDTGARLSFVQTQFAKNYEVVGSTFGGGISDSNIKTDLIRAHLKIGSDWEIDNATLGRTDRIPYNCLIGNNIFLSQNFTIDMQNLKITPSDINTNESLPLNIYVNELGGHFGFNVTIANETSESLFDTGATSTVIDIEFVNTHSEHFKFIKGIEVQDGNSANLKAGLYMLSPTFPTLLWA